MTTNLETQKGLGLDLKRLTDKNLELVKPDDVELRGATILKRIEHPEESDLVVDVPMDGLNVKDYTSETKNVVAKVKEVVIRFFRDYAALDDQKSLSGINLEIVNDKGIVNDEEISFDVVSTIRGVKQFEPEIRDNMIKTCHDRFEKWFSHTGTYLDVAVQNHFVDDYKKGGKYTQSELESTMKYAFWSSMLNNLKNDQSSFEKLFKKQPIGNRVDVLQFHDIIPRFQS